MRRISISQNPNSPAAYALNSPSTARSGGRRREQSESYPFPSNPLASPPLGKARDEPRTSSPPPSLRRRTTDFKDPVQGAKPNDQEAKPSDDTLDGSKTPFGTLSRNPALPLSAGLNGPSSPWASTPQQTGFSPMGAFGNFALGNNAAGTPSEKRPGFASGRAESRFKGLMSKDSGDENGRMLKEKTSLNNLGRGNESSAWRGQWSDQEATKNDAGMPSGSAALGGGQDISPPRRRDLHNLGTPSRQDSRDEYSFATFGMTSDPNFRGMVHDQQQHHTPQGRGQHPANEAMSPTNTNPYQSPEQDHADTEDVDTDGSDIHNAQLPGLGGFMGEGHPTGMGHYGALPNFGQGHVPAASDRSQTSSVGPQRGFGGLSGLGAISGISGSSAWGSVQGTMGTPIRERAGITGLFSDSTFSSAAEAQSPSLAGLGPSNFFGGHPSAASGAGRGTSRLGSLFPQAMQDQMRGPEQSLAQHDDDKGDGQRFTGGLARDNDGGFGFGRPAGADLSSGAQEENRQERGIAGESLGNLGVSGQGTGPQAQTQGGVSSASSQPPAAQQKTMVMPDRMRWIYRDPQGNTQGPWSGLEMHDWYKAGFFSPELLVKKFEDADYEPLAQLIRRIGNSREPFLVPQIGIPHGAASTTSWGSGPLSSAGTQPPFANSFPSFGTTLTADQQNALERRKQEEQYLMARQKEHLAQQQIAQRLSLSGQHSMLPQQLHHHSSAQSLHSQPSFSSITSPNNYQPSPIQGPSQAQQHIPGFFDNSLRAGQGSGFGAVGAGVDALGNIDEEDLPNSILERLNLGLDSDSQFGAPGQGLSHAQKVSNMLDDRAKLQQEQAQQNAEMQYSRDQPMSNERLREFNELQGQARAEQQPRQQLENELEQLQQDVHAAQAKAATSGQTSREEPLSLTEQVQQAASAQQTPMTQSPWGKIDTALPQPFPPAPSQSPLPAPAAQRSRSNVADALHAESRSRSQTPSLETPSASIAPWAKEPAEAPRGPSLKEIQEAEAKNAAKAEAIATELRRAALEKETLAQIQTVTPTVGLPSSSTWASASGASPVSPAVTSAWSKAAKPVATPTTAKSMAQIQKEEEARKKRIAAAAVATQNAALGVAAAQATGKRYAELVSKIVPSSPSPGPPGAWTTVGASGKVKPVVAATPTPVANRVPSLTNIPAAAAAAKKPAPTRSTTLSGASTAGQVNAQDEFKKWAVNELKHDLNKGVLGESSYNTYQWRMFANGSF